MDYEITEVFFWGGGGRRGGGGGGEGAGEEGAGGEGERGPAPQCNPVASPCRLNSQGTSILVPATLLPAVRRVGFVQVLA